MMDVRILAVDRAYAPDRWIDASTALNLYSRGVVRESYGETALRLRGGVNARTGKQSILEVGSILVIDTKEWLVRDFDYCPLEAETLFKRDRMMCAYCGNVFRASQLTRDHVKPVCQGGKDSWTNFVSACRACNQYKAGRTPEQAGMELLYVPYRPNRYEWLILKGRNIKADQMDWLMQGVPKHSRLHG